MTGDGENIATDFNRPAAHYTLFDRMRDQQILTSNRLYINAQDKSLRIKSVLREQTLNESSQKLTLIQRKTTIRHNE